VMVLGTNIRVDDYEQEKDSGECVLVGRAGAL
jgi:hypothetical protein